MNLWLGLHELMVVVSFVATVPEHLIKLNPFLETWKQGLNNIHEDEITKSSILNRSKLRCYTVTVNFYTAI